MTRRVTDEPYGEGEGERYGTGVLSDEGTEERTKPRAVRKQK